MEVELEEETDITSLVDLYASLKQEERTLRRRLDVVKSKIQDHMSEHNTFRIDTCKHSITKTEYETERVLARKELEKKYGEKWIQENLQKSLGVRLTVKQKELGE